MHAFARILIIVVLLDAGRSVAQPDVTGPASQGWEIAFRTGAMVPVGDAAEGAKLSDTFGVQFPLWLDLGYRFDKFFVGAYGQYAFGLLGKTITCDNPNLKCSVSAVRLGFEFQFHPGGRTKIDPWLGLGFGYQWSSIHLSDPSGSGTLSAEGWDLGRIEVGVDFAVGKVVRFAPFVGATIGQYGKTSASSSSGQERSGPIDQKAIHSWISFGLKAT